MRSGLTSAKVAKRITEKDSDWTPESEAFYIKKLAEKSLRKKLDKKDIEGKKLITAQELSSLISIPKYTILKLRRNGKIRAYSPTATLLFDLNEVVEDIKKLSPEKRTEKTEGI